MRAMTKPTLSLLSRLWLAEPDAAALAVAREEGIDCDSGPSELAVAWTDLFLLNVYPYGTAFTDISGELNGPAAAAASRRYEAAEYGPPELDGTGAPDHAGLCLGYLGHLAAQGTEDPPFLAWTLGWLPVCALAVERQSFAHPFYRDLAAVTRESLFAVASAPAHAPEDLAPVLEESRETEEEVGLSRVVRFLLAPAASGFFLSRSRLGELALEAGLRLPFGSRFEVARALFEAAGESSRVRPVLEALSCEAEAWDAAYAAQAREYPSWRTGAAVWRGRLAATRERLEQMDRILESPLEPEQENRAE